MYLLVKENVPKPYDLILFKTEDIEDHPSDNSEINEQLQQYKIEGRLLFDCGTDIKNEDRFVEARVNKSGIDNLTFRTKLKLAETVLSFCNEMWTKIS